ncbi:MAG: Fe-S cluster assembly protein SufD [Alphaproteobacteria bacterium]
MARIETPFADHFDTALLSGAPWIEALRRGGFDRYRALGLPTPRSEQWKYTNLRALARIPFAPAAPGSTVTAIPAGIAPLEDAYLAVIVNGRFDASLSALDGLPKGVESGSLAAKAAQDPAALEASLGRLADIESRPLAALNTASMADGLYLRLADGAALDKPLHLVCIGDAGDDPVGISPRHLIDMGAGSIATLVESHVGAGSYFANTVSEISVGAGAVLNHYKLQNEGPEAFHVAYTHVRLEDRSTYDGFVLQVGGKLARNEIRTHLGEHVECRLNGAYLGRGEQHIDNTTFIDHASPNSTSHEVYKGVLDGRSRGVFQGKILVRKDAQKTDGRQVNKTLLLSPGTEIDTKPELEIYADDVKCSHGATTGDLAEEALFYLMARGIDRKKAKAMLVVAFVGEAVAEIQSPGPRAAFQKTVDAWLGEEDEK